MTQTVEVGGEKTKTRILLDLLAEGRMKQQDAANIVGDCQLRTLIKDHAVKKIVDENPDYAKGRPGQKPMCFWVILGKPTSRGEFRRKPATEEGIRKAIAFLERHGYTVFPPDSPQPAVGTPV